MVAASRVVSGERSRGATLARPTFGYLLIHGLVGILGFATYFAFSRTVAPAAYADYALIVATATAINAFFYAWIGLSLNRCFQEPQVDQDRYVSSIVVMFAAISAVIVLLQLLLFGLWPRSIPTEILIACPLVTLLWAWFELSLQLARSRMQIANYGAKALLRAGILLGIGSALGGLGWGASGLLTGLVIGLVVAGASGLSKDLEGFSLRKADLAPLRHLYAYGWPLALCLGLSWVVGMSDRYLIYWLIGDEAAGQYALAYSFAQQPVWLVLLASSRATLPTAARAYEHEGEPGAKAVLSQNLGIMLMVCLPVVSLEVLTAPQLTGLFLGEAYALAGAAVMPVVAIATMFEGLRAFHLDIAVHLARRTRRLIGLWTLAAAANVLLNLVLIPRFGVVGAAWSTLIAHILAVAYFVLWIPRPDVLGFRGSALLRIGGALVTFAGILVLLPAGLSGAWFLIGVAAAGLVYGALAWLLEPVDLRASLG